MYYRCVGKLAGTCDFKQVTEKSIEQYLLDNVRTEMENFVLSADAEQKVEPKAKPKKSEAEKLQERLQAFVISRNALFGINSLSF